MTGLALSLLAFMSVWEYPARQFQHDILKSQFVTAMRGGNTGGMRQACEEGVKLLPDDPVWHFNLACSLAYFPKEAEAAFDELEKAIDLGFRDVEAIKNDVDLKRLAALPRYEQLIEYAEQKKTQPLLFGPMASVACTGVFGRQVTLGEQNLTWDLEAGCFTANMKLIAASAGGSTGDLYMNRDGAHSMIDLKKFPYLTVVKLDQEGRQRQADLNLPNIQFPYPVFGNCSMATLGTYWRSIPRSLMTVEMHRLRVMTRFYLANQVWVFPSNVDTAPIGKRGDVFSSIQPYVMVTAGKSWSDRPYIEGALAASASFRSEVKREIVSRGLLAPTIQTLIRKSLNTVSNETDYLSFKAHPTALPPDGLDLMRLCMAAGKLSIGEIPPVVPVTVTMRPTGEQTPRGEVSYISPFASAIVLRAKAKERVFQLKASGAEEYEFVQTHGDGVKVEIIKLDKATAQVKIDKTGMNPTNRVDITVVGKNHGTGWGAPSYVSFAVCESDDEKVYIDPVLK